MDTNVVFMLMHRSAMEDQREHVVDRVAQVAAAASNGVGNIDLPIGAHLVTPRRGDEHHGIYVGGDTVVHYGGYFAGLRRRSVAQVSLARFACGGPVRIRSYAGAKYSPRKAVARAWSRLGEDFDRLTTNNCENFCEWCLSGEARSEQIEGLRAWPRYAVVAAVRRLKEVLAGLNIQLAGG